MSKASFPFNGLSQDYEIPTEQITASYDGYRHFLNIPISFTFNFSPKNRSVYDIIFFKVILKNPVPNVFLSEIIHPHGHYVSAKANHTQINCSFALDEIALYVIENHRKKDMNLLLEFEVVYAERNVVNFQDTSLISLTKIASHYIVQGLNRAQFKTQINIPQSTWGKILNSLGHKNLKLIEIPLSHKSLIEAYPDIISEFNQAENYFNLQDYNKCIAHCRSALDALNRNLVKIRKLESSESNFKWLSSIDKSTLSWIDDLTKNTASIASKTHHASKNSNFSRAQAESIYAVTIGLLNYVAHLAN